MLRVSRQSIDVLGQKSSDLRIATQAIDVIGTTDPYLRVYRLAVEYLRLVPASGDIHEVGATSSVGITTTATTNIKSRSASHSVAFLQDASSNIVTRSAESILAISQSSVFDHTEVPGVVVNLNFSQTATYELIEVGQASNSLDLLQSATASLVKSTSAQENLAIGSEATFVGPRSAYASSLINIEQSTRFPQTSELEAESEVAFTQTATPGGTKRLTAGSTIVVNSLADNIIKIREATSQIVFSQSTAFEKIITAKNHLDFFQEVILGAVSKSAESHVDLQQTARHEPFPQSAITQLDITQLVHQNIRNVSASSVLDIGQFESVQKPVRAAATSELSQQEWLPDGTGSVTLQEIGLRHSCLVTHIGHKGVESVISFNQVADPVLVRAGGTNVSATTPLSITQEARLVETGTGETSFGISHHAEVLAGRPGENQLTLSQAAEVNLSQSVTAESVLAIRQASTYTVTSLMSVNHYSPFVGESTDPDAPTPPPAEINGLVSGIEVPFQLVYPATGTVTDSVSLRAPDLGNIDRLAFNRVQRETRGGTLVIYADPIWPKVQTLVLSFSGLKRIEAYNLLTFQRSHLGMEIGLIDWEHRYWKGVIINPDQPFVEDSFDSFSACFEFQGELDPTWSP